MQKKKKRAHCGHAVRSLAFWSSSRSWRALVARAPCATYQVIVHDLGCTRAAPIYSRVMQEPN